MSDAEAACCTRETSVGDEGNLVAHALAIKRGCRRQHLPHARAALGPFITDDQHVAFFVGPVFHGFETGFLTIETARRTGETQHFHTGNLNDRTLRREITLKTDDASGRQ